MTVAFVVDAVSADIEKAVVLVRLHRISGTESIGEKRVIFFYAFIQPPRMLRAFPGTPVILYNTPFIKAGDRLTLGGR